MYKLFKLIKNKVGPYPEQIILNIVTNTIIYGRFDNPYKILWVDPNAIKLKLDRKYEKKRYWGLGMVVGGDWDKRVSDINKTNTHLAIFQHFNNGIPWGQTKLFTEEYPERIKKCGRIKRCYNLKDLEQFYNTVQVDLFNSLKLNGFQIPSIKSKGVEYIYVYVGRNGEFIYTGLGNHRLAMAKVLKIDKIPVRVLARHKQWQKLRIMKIRGKHKNSEEKNEHPDLQF